MLSKYNPATVQEVVDALQGSLVVSADAFIDDTTTPSRTTLVLKFSPGIAFTFIEYGKESVHRFWKNEAPPISAIQNLVTGQRPPKLPVVSPPPATWDAPIGDEEDVVSPTVNEEEAYLRESGMSEAPSDDSPQPSSGQTVTMPDGRQVDLNALRNTPIDALLKQGIT